MRSDMFRFSVLAVGAATLIAGCAAPTIPQSAAPATTVSVRQQLNKDMQVCTHQSGYDPAQVNVAENALAPNELAWRQCMYKAVDAFSRSAPASIASMYQSLINSDIAMTSAIKDGTMTRAQRRTRIEQLVAEIQSAENKQAAGSAASQQRQDQEYTNTISAIRALGR